MREKIRFRVFRQGAKMGKLPTLIENHSLSGLLIYILDEGEKKTVSINPITLLPSDFS